MKNVYIYMLRIYLDAERWMWRRFTTLDISKSQDTLMIAMYYLRVSSQQCLCSNTVSVMNHVIQRSSSVTSRLVMGGAAPCAPASSALGASPSAASRRRQQRIAASRTATAAATRAKQSNKLRKVATQWPRSQKLKPGEGERGAERRKQDTSADCDACTAASGPPGWRGRITVSLHVTLT